MCRVSDDEYLDHNKRQIEQYVGYVEQAGIYLYLVKANNNFLKGFTRLLLKYCNCVGS